ncbi:hypothetical protein HK103_006823 [Boothiomyces macroporosus]|uniref:Uncharacterized protein n=1 Tax=Boothiomyces macroporosus TaxID=261099 RepID=A0AAD5Y4D2_9FUNG|nr:hypothetical protein HK103_006823 [Boothiomyces macroporosus]
MHTNNHGVGKDGMMPPIGMPVSSPSQHTMMSFAHSDSIDQLSLKPQSNIQPPLLPNNAESNVQPPTIANMTGVSQPPLLNEKDSLKASQPPILNNHTSQVGELPIMNPEAQQTHQPPIIQKTKPKTRRKVKDDLDFEDSDDEDLKSKSGTSALADFFNESRIQRPSKESTPVGSQTNIGIINESERNEFMPPTMK